jgi:hypothetical protein
MTPLLPRVLPTYPYPSAFRLGTIKRTSQLRCVFQVSLIMAFPTSQFPNFLAEAS